MKIDLHVHTQKCKSGDGNKRNITPENFVKKMNDNDVAICSITNHNKFDLKEYEKIANLDEELVIFPGIELDIRFDKEKHFHIIAICEPNKKKDFYEVFDNDENRNYDDFILDYSDFINKVKNFEKHEIIIIPHFLDKDKKRALNFEDKEKLKEELLGYVFILEPSHLQSMGMINAHDELSLIGSDIKDWDCYDATKLPDIKFKIDSFGKFYELANDSKQFIKNALNGAVSYDIDIDEDNDSRVKIYEDTNIIFGEKGSGKTILIKKYIYPYFQKLGKDVFLHEGKDYDTAFEDLKKEYIDSVEIDAEQKNNLETSFEEIISYNEKKLDNFVKVYKDYHEKQTTNKRAQNIKKTDSIFSETNSDSFSSIHNTIKKQLTEINKVEKINEEVRNSRISDREILDKELKKLTDEILILSMERQKELFVYNGTNSLLNTIKESVKKKTGKINKPSKIGFAELVSKRFSCMKHFFELKQTFKEIQNSVSHKLGILPNKGEVFLETNILVLSKDDKHNKNSAFDKNRIVSNRNIIGKISDFSTKKFPEINEYFDSTEKETSPQNFVSDVVRKDSKISIKGDDNYQPSEGEKAILSISGLLENSRYECYLFDEVERGLGNKYISDYLIPKINNLRNIGKTVVLSTHNANIAINTLPSQCIYANYSPNNINKYYLGNAYQNELIGVSDTSESLIWEENALVHLEGSKEMFSKRRNIYGI